ncbi:MAG: Na+/H+ antiporter NhaC family protein [Acidobacteriota bacterium]
MTDQQVPSDGTTVEKHRLALRGGVWGAAVILVIALAFLTLAAINQSKIEGYVVAFLVPLLVAVFLAKDEREYGRAVIAGLSKPMFGIIALGVILASLAGQLVSQSGLIQSIAHMAVLAGLAGKDFAGVTFLVTCLISFSTGTSVGTYFVVIPILFPAGVVVGAHPLFLIGSIAAGGAFGDNLAPVSDTTIASATTQGVDLGGVVRSRMKYSLPVALVALVIYFVFSPSGEALGEAPAERVKPMALIMLVVPAVVVTLCLLRKHLVTALAVGSMAGVAVGLLAGVFAPTQLLSFPGPFEIEGLLPGSVESALPTLAFLMVVFPFLGLMEASGTLEKLGDGIAKLARGPRSVEIATVLATGVLSMVTGVISVAIISIGDVVKTMGLKFKVDGYRRANLMDCAGATFCYIVPWTVHAIVPAMLAGANNPLESGTPVSPLAVPMHNFYSWVMLAMLVISIVSGYGRSFVSDTRGGAGS